MLTRYGYYGQLMGRGGGDVVFFCEQELEVKLCPVMLSDSGVYITNQRGVKT